MTHDELVNRAAQWLRGVRKCSVVACFNHNGIENPDAIGWNCCGWSWLIECKISRADFFRDCKKHVRRFPASGMGSYRFYLATPGLLKPEEMPPGWGLLECGRRGIRKVKAGEFFSERNQHAELSLMASASVRRKDLFVAPTRARNVTRPKVLSVPRYALL